MQVCQSKEEWRFPFWNIFCHFCVMSDDIIGSSTETVQHLIKNIFRNIKAVVFKLGTRNAQKNKMTPVVAFVPLFLFLFKLNFSDSPVPFQRVVNGHIWLFTERDWSRKCWYGNNMEGVILFLLWCTFLVPSLKNTAPIFYISRDILDSVFYWSMNDLWRHHFPHLHNTKMFYSKTKWSVPLTIPLMNWLFKIWIC